MMLHYEGIFFDEESVNIIHSLETEQLARINDEIHCTFKYKPKDDEIFNEIVGKNFELYLVGYANDDNNSGFEILLPQELLPYYINYDEENPEVLKIPHITASLSENAIASNTKNLKFVPLEHPVKVTGKFGFWIKSGTEEYVSYEPYSFTKLTKHQK